MVDVFLCSDYYTNKLYKIRRGPQRLGGPISVFVSPGEISFRGLVYNYSWQTSNSSNYKRKSAKNCSGRYRTRPTSLLMMWPTSSTCSFRCVGDMKKILQTVHFASVIPAMPGRCGQCNNHVPWLQITRFGSCHLSLFGKVAKICVTCHCLARWQKNPLATVFIEQSISRDKKCGET